MSVFFFLDYHMFLCDRQIGSQAWGMGRGHHYRSLPLGEVQIPQRTAARAHVVVINKGRARQFYLSSDRIR